MIRKLKTGEYRLYSERSIQRPENGGIWERSKPAKRLRSTKEPCSTLSIVEFRPPGETISGPSNLEGNLKADWLEMRDE